MMLAQDVAEFVGAPVERCIVRPQLAVWCGAPDLIGLQMWGTLDLEELRELFAILEFVHHPALSHPGKILMDCREVERVLPEVVLEFVARARERMPVWAAMMAHHAVIVPEGLPSIFLAGAFPQIWPTQPLMVYDVPAALAFLDHPRAAPSHAAVVNLTARARGGAALVGRLRAHIMRDAVGATVDESAEALGMTTRALQHELKACGTSFSAELRRVRVVLAEQLICHSDLKIELIARRVGLSSPTRMAAALRRERGVTSAELRARGRRPVKSPTG